MIDNSVVICASTSPSAGPEALVLQIEVSEHDTYREVLNAAMAELENQELPQEDYEKVADKLLDFFEGCKGYWDNQRWMSGNQSTEPAYFVVSGSGKHEATPHLEKPVTDRAKMALVKVDTLSGRSLDWAVAKVAKKLDVHGGVPAGFNPSADQAQGGELIDQYGVATRFQRTNGQWFAMLSDHLGDAPAAEWVKFRWVTPTGQLAHHPRNVQCRFVDKSRLVAGMRAIVASELGEELEVPAGLLESQAADIDFTAPRANIQTKPVDLS